MPSLLVAVFCVLLICVTALGIVTSINDDSQRPGYSQSNSGLVLYGGR